MKIFSLCHHYRNISVRLFVCVCFSLFDGSASISHIIDAANLTNVALQFLFVATGGRLFRSVKWFNQLYTQMMSIYILYKMSEVLNLDLFMLGYVLILPPATYSLLCILHLCTLVQGTIVFSFLAHYLLFMW